jgi:hypothetical protein
MNANKVQSLQAVIANIITTDAAINAWLFDELYDVSTSTWLGTNPGKTAAILGECVRMYGEAVSGLESFIGHEDFKKEIAPEEQLCFWCTDPFWPGQNPVIVERTVCDNNGSHIEETFFHAGCVGMAIRELL